MPVPGRFAKQQLHVGEQPARTQQLPDGPQNHQYGTEAYPHDEAVIQRGQ